MRLEETVTLFVKSDNFLILRLYPVRARRPVILNRPCAVAADMTRFRIALCARQTFFFFISSLRTLSGSTSESFLNK